MEIQNQKKSFGKWLKTSITVRMLMVGILILVLLIPLSYIKNLIQERSFRQKEVVSDNNQKWGNRVTLYGPILKIPYKVHTPKKSWDETTKSYFQEDIITYQYAYFFPEKLNIDAGIDPETLKRGIYESIVYTAEMKLKGSFVKPDFETSDIKTEDVVWNKASIILQSTNLKGIRNNLEVKIGSVQYPLQSKFNNNANFKTLESKFLEEALVPKETPMHFELDLKINGSEQLRFIPVGKETNVAMSSSWASPSFDGNYLPDPKTKKITKDGFKAQWKVLQINRDFEQQFFENLPDIRSSAFGVTLVNPVDEYLKNERTAKYGYLVIALTFLLFFLLQTVSKINIHPFQYLMIGLALSMFYTLLLSISEHSSYLSAYGVAAIAVITLISVYSKSILKSLKFMLLIAASLTALYSFIFVLIQLEDYALLVGSIGLFLILGTVMMVSRSIDWGMDDK